MTTSGRMRPFVAQTTGQYLDPLLVFTNLVRLTSRFMVPPIRLIAKYGSSIGSSCSQSQDNKGNGGEGGIRTPDTLSGMPVFKTGAINHSATSPVTTVLLQSSMARDRHKLFRTVWIHQYLAGFARF